MLYGQATKVPLVRRIKKETDPLVREAESGQIYDAMIVLDQWPRFTVTACLCRLFARDPLVGTGQGISHPYARRRLRKKKTS